MDKSSAVRPMVAVDGGIAWRCLRAPEFVIILLLWWPNHAPTGPGVDSKTAAELASSASRGRRRGWCAAADMMGS